MSVIMLLYIIGAGSLVINDLPDNGVYVGSPAVLMKKLDPIKE